MNNRLVLISIATLFVHNICFSMNDPREKAREKVYASIKELKEAQSDYAQETRRLKSKFNNGAFGKNELARKESEKYNEEISLCNEAIEEIQDALNNQDLPEHVINTLKNVGHFSEHEMNTLSQDLVKKYYK